MPSVLTDYWGAVAEVLGGADPRHRSACIRMGRSKPLGFDGDATVLALLNSIAQHWPDEPATRTTNNWLVRRDVPPFVTRSPEVALERTIAARASGSWFCQMSTASGIHGPAADKRRAIDLVHRPTDGHFRFVELKIESDNPLYAIFEVLSYGLIYLLSRRAASVFGYTDRAVMSATSISLIVLAPAGYFTYRHRGAAAGSPYELGWLKQGLSDGLRTVAGDDLSMDLQCVAFEQGTSLEESARSVIDVFERRAVVRPDADRG